MTDLGGPEAVAILEGACPAGTASVEMVRLREGDIFQIGRSDRAWALRAGLSATHLALPRTARRTVPALALVLAVGRAAVVVQGGRRLVQILVDGQPLGPEPLSLAGPVHEVLVDPLGVPQRLRIGFCLRQETAAADPLRAIPGSGTVVPVLRVAGSRLRPMAAALAWPLLSGVAPALSLGWSTAQVAARYTELWGREPDQPRRTLHDLRAVLAGASAEDGRPMVTISDVQPWPWPSRWQDAGLLSKAEFAEAKNRIVGLYFAAASDVVHMVGEALERPRGMKPTRVDTASGLWEQTRRG